MRLATRFSMSTGTSFAKSVPTSAPYVPGPHVDSSFSVPPQFSMLFVPDFAQECKNVTQLRKPKIGSKTGPCRDKVGSRGPNPQTNSRHVSSMASQHEISMAIEREANERIQHVKEMNHMIHMEARQLFLLGVISDGPLPFVHGGHHGKQIHHSILLFALFDISATKPPIYIQPTLFESVVLVRDQSLQQTVYQIGDVGDTSSFVSLCAKSDFMPNPESVSRCLTIHGIKMNTALDEDEA
ncbi:hypothetical protein CR513_17441, partial [Mucuna pruriens]